MVCRQEAKGSANVIMRYLIPLPVESGYKNVQITLSLPSVPPRIEGLDFIEHVMDPLSGTAGKTVVLGGKGCLAVSEDLGETWREIPTEGYENHRWWNCFTTSTGRHIVQSFGWQGPADPVADPDKHAALLVFSPDWELIGRTKARDAHWHGTASIGESGGTIMFAEYFNNLERYSLDFESKKSEYLKTLRANAIGRSRDDGASWQKVFELGPLEIRHFHTVIPDRFISGTWWASSGDMAHECRVWRTDDDGDLWREVTNNRPDVRLPPTYMLHAARCQRYTDVIVEADRIIWGADDYLGPLTALSEDLPAAERTGSRIYISPKTSPISPREIGLVGHPVRKLVDVGPGWFVMTEAKHLDIGIKPNVFLLFKESLLLVKLLELQNWSGRGTGFTYSRGSEKSHDGCFFTYRERRDVFDGGIRCLKWKVEFD